LCVVVLRKESSTLVGIHQIGALLFA